MLIEILKKTSTPSHSLKAGDVVDMRGSDAQKLIDKKLAKKAKKK